MSPYWFKWIIVGFLLVSQTECCVKRFKEIKRKIIAKFGRPPRQQQGQGAILDQEPISTYPSYLKHHNFFVELEEFENGTFQVLNLDRLPPILSQTLNKNETFNITALTFVADNVTESAQTAQQQNETNSLDVDYELGELTGIPTDVDLFQADSPGLENVTNSKELQISTTQEPMKETIAAAVDVKKEEEEEVLTEEDIAVRAEWGGECTNKHWNRCNKIRRLLSPYTLANLTKKEEFKIRWMDIDCLVEPILCLCNGWTVNRCHVMCMSKCNPEMLVLWDVFVLHEGECAISAAPNKKKNPCQKETVQSARHEFG